MSNLDQRFDAMARRKYGISGNELLDKTEKGESGGRGNAVSSAGARGWMQFMPGTRAAVKKKYGIDPWRSRAEAREAAKHHMVGDLGNAEGLEGYNPGGGQQYVKYILGQKGKYLKGVAPPTLGTTADKPRIDAPDTTVEDSILASFMSGGKRKGSLFDDVMHRVSLAPPTVETQTDKLKSSSSSTTPAGASGNFSVAPTANRKGANLKPYMTAFAGQMAAVTGGFTIGTGTNHNQMTVNGNVSDHWDGSGMDIPATGKHGDAIAYAAFVSAGVPAAKAKLWSKNGGLYNVTKNGTRYQIIWKTNEGGNHYNHVHVGLRPGK